MLISWKALETTASGKTTIGAGVKFMIKVSASDKKLHSYLL